MDAVAGRLSAPLAGAQITLTGQSVDLSRTGDSAVLVDAMTGLARAFGAPGGAAASGVTAPGAWPDRHGGAWDSPAPSGGSPVRSVTGRELLLGSSFHLALDGAGGGGGTGLTAWGRATVGGFDGQGDAETGAMRMDGEVITGILGANAQRGRWLAGLALSVSEGEGTFEQPEAGQRGTIESNLTSVNPYLRFEASERLSTWGLLGFGTGEMTMTEAARGERGETVTRTGIEMRLAAVGARGALLDAAASGGFDLAVKADAFLVETEWEKVSNERDTQAGASRVRLVLEGSRAFELSESAKLTPGLELGLRHDGGDAETGTGVEVGGSVRYADAASGLSVEARGRTLIAHEASGFEEWGASASVRLDPGAEGRGLSFSLAPSLGAASNGVDRLWSLQDARGLAPEGKFVAARSLEAQIGYRETAMQEVRTRDGRTRVLAVTEIAASPEALAIRKRLREEVFASAILGAKASVVVIVLFLALFQYRGYQLNRAKRLRGAELASAGQLGRRIRPLHARLRKFSRAPPPEPYRIAGVSYPARTETQRTIVSGTTGSGKTVLISDLVAQIRDKGERCVVYDKMGSYTLSFFDPARDVLLNPLDARAPRWCPSRRTPSTRSGSPPRASCSPTAPGCSGAGASPRTVSWSTICSRPSSPRSPRRWRARSRSRSSIPRTRRPRSACAPC